MPKAKTSKSQKQKAESVKKMQVISLRLRKGDMTTVAEKTGYDPSHVSRVLRGQRNNAKIVDTAYAMVSKRKVNS